LFRVLLGGTSRFCRVQDGKGTVWKVYTREKKEKMGDPEKGGKKKNKGEERQTRTRGGISCARWGLIFLGKKIRGVWGHGAKGGGEGWASHKQVFLSGGDWAVIAKWKKNSQRFVGR